MFAPKGDVTRRRELVWIANNATGPPLMESGTSVTLLREIRQDRCTRGLLNPLQGAANSAPLVVVDTEHSRWADLGRNTPWFTLRSPQTTYTSPYKNNTLPKITDLVLLKN